MDLLCTFQKKSWSSHVHATEFHGYLELRGFGQLLERPSRCATFGGWEEAVYIQFSESLPIHITRSEQGIDLSPIFSEPVTINLERPMELIQWVEQCSKTPLPCLVAAFWRWANCLYFDTKRSGDVSGGCSCPKDRNLIQSQDPLDVEGGRWHSFIVHMYLLKAHWGGGFMGFLEMLDAGVGMLLHLHSRS
jgi:hypothetical protein